MERMPEKPSQELIVALAGPAVNVVIAAGLLLWLGMQLDPESLTKIEDPTVSLAAKVAGANIILVLFQHDSRLPHGRRPRVACASRHAHGECACHRARRHDRLRLSSSAC
jgi:hypothetical protein